MKTLFLAYLLVFASAEDDSPAPAPDEAPSAVAPGPAKSSSAEGLMGYHQLIGIPEAERIRLKESVRPRIANGAGSYNGAHPYMAGLLVTLTSGPTSLCGGSLINSRRVLTAATCWYDGYSQGSSILVVLGTADLFSGGTRLYASQVYTHNYFNPYNHANDIAMLVIPYVSWSPYIGAITLPYGNYQWYSYSGWTAQAIGYGRANDNTGYAADVSESQTLRDVFLDVISNADCQAYYGYYITYTNLCTSGAGGKGPCRGDVGSPLVLRRYDGTNDMLIGVVSFGSPNGCLAGHPTAYSRVTEYINWIQNLS